MENWIGLKKNKNQFQSMNNSGKSHRKKEKKKSRVKNDENRVEINALSLAATITMLHINVELSTIFYHSLILLYMYTM